MNNPILASTPSGEYFGVYSDSFRKQVHQLIAWGHIDACQRIQSLDVDEPSITGFMTEAIQSRFRASDVPRWCTRYSVKDDPPVKAAGRSGRERPRADIIIEGNFQGRPEYVFEAKRLRKCGFGVNKYIDSGGMGCFISGLYASRYDEAAMLGYVQSDLLAHWQVQVKRAIDGNGSQLQFQHPLSVMCKSFLTFRSNG